MSLPVFTLTPKGAARLRKGHPWIFRSDIATPPSARGGDLVIVRLPDGRPGGLCTWSDQGQLAARLTPLPPDAPDPEVAFLNLVDLAVARRTGRPAACRLINGDADGLPGLIVDRYGAALSVQCLTQATARRREALVDRLRARTGARLVVARDDVKVRAFEGLPLEKSVLFADPDAGIDPHDVLVEMHGLRLRYDLLEGQKTGGFLDQTDNRVAAAAFAHGEVLDCFSYDGGFSLHLAAAGCRVTAVDSSGPALARLTRRAVENGLDIATAEENVFDLLRQYERDGRRFDAIVLDPPAFAKSRDAIEAGRRAYKEINLRGLKLLRPGGRLVTCSCSAHMDRAGFEGMLAEAAADARRFVRVIERRSAAPDHPTLVTAPETDYLKVLFAEAH
jgi:23S rRNA (cytosine1962-C5)-methyltransferase